LYHAILSYQQVFCPFAFLRGLTIVRPVTFVSAELCQWMGSLRLGYAALSLQSLIIVMNGCSGAGQAIARQNSLLLAIVGFGQLIAGLVSWQKGRWIGLRLLSLLALESCLAAGHLLHYLDHPRRRPSRDVD
jgi:hypothetical protein